MIYVQNFGDCNLLEPGDGEQGGGVVEGATASGLVFGNGWRRRSFDDFTGFVFVINYQCVSLVLLLVLVCRFPLELRITVLASCVCPWSLIRYFGSFFESGDGVRARGPALPRKILLPLLDIL